VTIVNRKGVYMKPNIKIKEFRNQKGITQVELAEKMSITQSTLSKYERGEKTPSLERTIEIASILGITVDELINFNKLHDQYSEKLKEIVDSKNK